MISVCIATYNGEKYIKEELLSILPQLSSDDEIIISDDGSTDRTIQEIESVKDSRITVYTHIKKTKNSNLHVLVTNNFENAISHAKGEIVFLADQDDIWHHDKIQQCLKMLDKHTLVIHNLNCVDSSLTPLNKTIYGDEGFRFKNYLILGDHSYFGCAMAFKRELIDLALPFPSGLTAHDLWLGLMAETFFNAAYIKEPLIDYRIHTLNTSSIDNYSLFYLLSYRINLLWNIFLKCLKKRQSRAQ